MIKKRFSKTRLGKFVFGCLFAIISMFGVATLPVANVYAEPSVETTQQLAQSTSCEKSVGRSGWHICSIVESTSGAVDWLYEKIEDILIINPVEMKDGSPIYELWKYALGVTNIVFIILLLVVVYSQLTGLGISNYGIKKILPKLIVVAVLVNLSFAICSFAVDVSNAIGGSLRGLLSSIENSALSSTEVSASDYYISMAQMYTRMAEGAAITIAGLFIAFETGSIWMLIPVALGGLVAVASGLITITLRQAVVTLLIMIAPLAIVAYMLPNTEKWFKKWKDLFVRMLVFYPLFSLLFGASSLAGMAIIANAARSNDGFGLMLGTAVRILPLLFSWSLMKMSGTFLGTVNAKLNSWAAKPLAANRAWAESRREHTRQKYLASGNAYTPSLRLRQYLFNRKVAREEETKEYAEVAKNRGLAYAANRNYKKDGTPTRSGEESYEMQARNMQYQRAILRHKNNMNKGLGQLEAVKMYSSTAQKARLDALDVANMNEADYLKIEQARGAKIDYDNAKGFQDRMSKAMDAHFDQLNAGNVNYQLHGVLRDGSNIGRYKQALDIMEGNTMDVHFAAADAAYNFNAQAQIVQSRFQKYMDLTAPTQDVFNRLSELTSSSASSAYIDPIIAGLRTLNMRGDTDLVRKQIHGLLDNKKIELGTYASQSLANFLMFDVKGNDPFLRRFGKYINLETAQMFNEKEPEKRRSRKDVSLYEYVNGEYVDYDENGNIKREADGTIKVGKSKRGAKTLLQGTSFKDMERTAISDMIESIREYSVSPDENGNERFDFDKFMKNEKDIWDAIMPNIISDQFAFLSGSEQILALSKGITGVDVKDHKIDWRGIFGKDADNLTPEQKAIYAEALHERTRAFLRGHVPVQIAKTKTDMLNAYKTQYAIMEEIWGKGVEFEYDEEGNRRIHRDADGNPVPVIKDGDVFDIDYEDNKTGYDEFEKRHFEGMQREFRKSFNKTALEGFLMQFKKGYQGEAKEGLTDFLGAKELYEKLFPDSEHKNRKQRNSHENEDGYASGPNEGVDPQAGASAVYNNARMAFEQIYHNRTGNETVAEFWEMAKNVISGYADARAAGGLSMVFNDIDGIINSITSVDALYNEIMHRIFGGY